jgi:hypothetical protein
VSLADDSVPEGGMVRSHPDAKDGYAAPMQVMDETGTDRTLPA